MPQITFTVTIETDDTFTNGELSTIADALQDGAEVALDLCDIDGEVVLIECVTPGV